MIKYAKELGEVLRTFNPDKMRKFAKKWGMSTMFPKIMYNDKYLKGTMAKMVLARTDMSEMDRARAMGILDELGWDHRISL